MNQKSTPPFIEGIELVRNRVPSFDQYPYSIPAIQALEQLEFHPNVTFFVGENGTGKSTLLEAIAVAEGLNPEGGGRNLKFSTRKSHSALHECLRIARPFRRMRGTDGYFFRAESFFNVATEVEKVGSISYGDRLLHEQSHGESFLSVLLNRFYGNGIYLLDEPESALSPFRQLSLLTAIHDLVNTGSQFIIATHSPIVLAYPEAIIYEFSDSKIHPVEYTETEHYKVSKAFFDHKNQMLKELLSES